jgi:serine/threonine-protein kinase
VLEFVDGPTLADRIAKGPVPLDEALPIAWQITEALAAAHERGIIHRDLKPANIKVKEDGTVKVLDFGLAKALAPEAGSEAAGDFANSPTITAGAATEHGIILGTAAYMAPEQAKGRVVDKRADVWAFGVVLFEMVSGQKAFPGDGVTEILAAVIKTDPDWSALPAATPPSIRRLLRRCLAKAPKDRLPDIGAARLDIEDATSERDDDAVGSAVAGRKSSWGRAWPIAASLVVGLAAGAALWNLGTEDEPQGHARFKAVLDESAQTWTGGIAQDVTISPDGSRIFSLVRDAVGVRMYTGLTREGVTQYLEGALDGNSLAVSPDNRRVAFFDSRDDPLVGELKVLPVSGGAPVVLNSDTLSARGLTWAGHDSIIFGSAEGGLSRVSVSDRSAEAKALTTLRDEDGETAHAWPFYIEQANAVLFVVAQGSVLETGQLWVLDLDTQVTKSLGVEGTSPRYVSTGHLLYARADRSVWAQPFDIDDLSVSGAGAEVRVLEDVLVKASGSANFAVSTDGDLFYMTGFRIADAPRGLAWLDRKGVAERIDVEQAAFAHVRVSPDGRRLALDVAGFNRDVFILEEGRRTPRRLTRDAAVDRNPIWLDNNHVVFSSDRDGDGLELWMKASNGTGTATRLTDSEADLTARVAVPGWGLIAESWGDEDILAVRTDRLTTGLASPEALVANEGRDRNATLSPDGEWMAYSSGPEFSFEVYVQPFPDVGGDRTTVSAAGGAKPVWSVTGNELFYVQDGSMWAVQYTTEPSFEVGRPDPLFDVEPYYGVGSNRQFDIHPESGRFVMITESTESPELYIELNWFEELQRLMDGG